MPSKKTPPRRLSAPTPPLPPGPPIQTYSDLGDEDAFWLRATAEFWVPIKPQKATKQAARITAAVLDAVRCSSAVERFDATGGGGEEARDLLVRAHIDATRRYLKATRHGAEDVPGWVEVTAHALLRAMRKRSEVGVATVAGRWLRGLNPDLVIRRATSARGLLRVRQRRIEAEHHRSEWRKVISSNPLASKAWAAEVIADECRKAGRACQEATVLGHLKGRTKVGQ